MSGEEVTMQNAAVRPADDNELAAGVSKISVEKAKSLVALFARVTTSRNIAEFVGGFTEDCVTRFNCSPEMHGRDELRAFMRPRLARYPESYRCDKRLRAISGNVLGVEFVSTWLDQETGKPMIGRGSEFWLMRGDQILRWDACFGT
jgi:nuclear transport factor 2 (NTF2) superfamily protein